MDCGRKHFVPLLFFMVDSFRRLLAPRHGRSRWYSYVGRPTDAKWRDRLPSTDRAPPPTAGKIVNGEFRFLCKPGAMRVEIDAARKTGKRDPIEGFEITELYIPAKYNRSSELMANVTLDGENHFNFALAP